MVRKTYWAAISGLALIAALAFSAGVGVAAPSGDFLKATDAGSMGTPTVTAKATEKPEATAMATEKPEATAKATEKPEATAKATEKPEATAKATEKPEATATATPSASSGVLASPAVTVQVASNTTLGNILTDSQGMTLYIFKNDTPGTSNCNGTCAQNWLPLTVTAGQQPVAGTGITGQLGVIQRSDGTYQVTYDGLPLYHFIGDKQPGDTTGQGMLNGAWSVVTLTAAAPAAPAAPAAATPMAPAVTPQATSSY